MRVVYQVVKSGQPRAYADSEYVGRVVVEAQKWRPAGEGPWEPFGVSEEAARRLAFAFNARPEGPPLKNEAGFMESYLEYFRPVGEDTTVLSHSGRVSSSVWEWSIVTPFTD